MSGSPFHLVFVCTGNTCRSPLAEVIARAEAERRGWTQLQVSSAGVAAAVGAPASEGSVQAAEAIGLDLSEHGSQPVTEELVDQVDLILTMSMHHLMRVQDLGGGGRATLLTAFAEGLEGEEVFNASGVPDPFGGELAEYLETRDHIQSLVHRVLDRLAPILDP